MLNWASGRGTYTAQTHEKHFHCNLVGWPQIKSDLSDQQQFL